MIIGWHHRVPTIWKSANHFSPVILHPYYLVLFHCMSVRHTLSRGGSIRLTRNDDQESFFCQVFHPDSSSLDIEFSNLRFWAQSWLSKTSMFPSSSDPRHSRNKTWGRSSASGAPGSYDGWESDGDLIQLNSPELKPEDVASTNKARTHSQEGGRGVSKYGGRE